MKIYSFLAEGFETVEALGVIDLLRRDGIEVVTVSITDSNTVISAQKIPVIADAIFSELDFEDGDGLFLPGGIPGTPNLEAHEGLVALIRRYNEQNKYLVAICAAPSILGKLNILDGKNATCYPGYEKELLGSSYRGDGVVVDNNIITARGMGKTIDLGLRLIELFDGKENAINIGNGIQYLV